MIVSRWEIGDNEPLECKKCGTILRDHALLAGLSVRCPECNEPLKEKRMEWFKTFDNVHALGQWLAERGDLDIRTVWYFLSKPWKWEEEWKEYQLSKEGL